jgi:hypothetical protein
MSDHPSQHHAAMEGQGAYNRHSRLPAGGGGLALAHLERAIATVPLGVEAPVVVADYGSSQGRNSLAPMRVAIETIRARAGADRPILVFHEDQPENDFAALFELLRSHPDRYHARDGNVFPCAIGRSFYEPLLPSNFVHVGWSSYAAMWISRAPRLIPGHFAFSRSSGEVRAAFEAQADRDWRSFLCLRARELRPGACLIVTIPGADESGSSVFEGIWDHANDELSDLVAEGAVTPDERRNMVLPVWPRRLSDLIAPFAASRCFETLRLEESETATVRDATWEEYERDRDAGALADKHSMFFRAVFAPTLASALTRRPSGDAAAREFADRLTSGLRRRLQAAPAHMHSLVQILVLRKQI